VNRRTDGNKPIRDVSRNGDSHVRGGWAATVYDWLHDLIVRGKLAPGARITEAEVSLRLGVSRTPVRSAIQRLEHEGYVLTSRENLRAQAVVAPLTRQDALELLNIVGEIEGLAARYAAALDAAPRARLVSALRAANKRLASAAKSRASTPDQIFDLDQDFHRVYVEGAGGLRLGQLHRLIKPQAERYIRVYVSILMERMPTSVREHDTIIRAIDSGRPNVAQHAVQANWRNAGARLGRVIELVGERGSW
jgi:DNA-binding GntR family transcriptional regulator